MERSKDKLTHSNFKDKETKSENLCTYVNVFGWFGFFLENWKMASKYLGETSH